MIIDFFFSNESKNIFKVDVGGEFIFFENDYNNNFVDLYYDGSLKNIGWVNGNKTIRILSDKQSIVGYPSVDLNYVIAVYYGDEGEYLPPCNAVIYNADGSVHKELCVPLLVSEAAKNRGLWKRELNCGIVFSNVCWKKDSNGQPVVAMEIQERYGSQFREIRALNPETGEFGECLHGAVEYK